MTDYTHNTGSSGVMLIRDQGLAVEFWINAQNSTTWSDHIPWSWSVPWASSSGSFYYHPNSGWQRITTIQVGSSANVTFSLGNTGTQGFGGPTNFTVFLNRSTVPPAPNGVTFSSVNSTSLHAVFTGNGDGGSGITAWQMGYGINPGTPVTIINTYDTTITGLSPGTTYYFWARGVNANGNGGWSVRTQVTTQKVPDTLAAPHISAIQPTAVTLDWSTFNASGINTPGINIPVTTQYDVGYDTNPAASPPGTTLSNVTDPYIVTGLSPGVVYYFQVRSKNSVGYSAWSERSSTRTIAAARVLVGSTWKLAVPYVKVSGVWKLAVPWVRSAGVWKETM